MGKGRESRRRRRSCKWSTQSFHLYLARGLMQLNMTYFISIGLYIRFVPLYVFVPTPVSLISLSDEVLSWMYQTSGGSVYTPSFLCRMSHFPLLALFLRVIVQPEVWSSNCSQKSGKDIISFSFLPSPTSFLTFLLQIVVKIWRTTDGEQVCFLLQSLIPSLQLLTITISSSYFMSLNAWKDFTFYGSLHFFVVFITHMTGWWSTRDEDGKPLFTDFLLPTIKYLDTGTDPEILSGTETEWRKLWRRGVSWKGSKIDRRIRLEWLVRNVSSMSYSVVITSFISSNFSSPGRQGKNELRTQ